MADLEKRSIDYFLSLRNEKGQTVFSRGDAEKIVYSANKLALEKLLAGEEPFDSGVIVHYFRIYNPEVTLDVFKEYHGEDSGYAELIFDAISRLDESEINNLKHLKFCSNPCGMDCI